MLTKLALRNAKRSIRDYLIYFITVIISFTMIISYNVVIFSEQVAELTTMMNAFKISVIVASVFVVFVIGWLIYYISNFMLDKRAKEFGLYMTLGIEQSKIKSLFTIEFLVINILSFIISFILSIFLSNLLTTIITSVFEYAYTVKPNLSFSAVLVSLIYFVVINLFIIMKLNRKLKKQKIKDLLYLDKSNESKKVNIAKSIMLMMFFTLLCVANVCYFIWMFSDGENNLSFYGFFMVAILLIIGIYGFTFYIIDVITYYLLKNKKFKYTQDHLFVIRQFSSKMKTMGMTLGTISVLILITLLSLNISNLFEQTYKNIMDKIQPFDVTTYNLPYDNDFSSTYAFVEKHTKITDSIEYTVYTDGDIKFVSDEERYNLSGQIMDYYLKLSDYNKLLAALGKEEVTLEENQYIVHSDESYRIAMDRFLNSPNSNINSAITKDINVKGHTLALSKYINKGLPQCFCLGAMYIIIVNDDIVKDMTPVQRILSINTADELKSEDANKFDSDFEIKREKLIIEGKEEKVYSLTRLAIKYKDENNTTIITITFCLVYLAIVFILVIGTIVSVQSLYDSVKYKTRYRILGYLGSTDDSICATVRKQLKLYYSYPVILPLVISLIMIITLNNSLFCKYVEFSQFLLNVGTSFFIFFSIYVLYYFVTYLQFKKNIL